MVVQGVGLRLGRASPLRAFGTVSRRTLCAGAPRVSVARAPGVSAAVLGVRAFSLWPKSMENNDKAREALMQAMENKDKAPEALMQAASEASEEVSSGVDSLGHTAGAGDGRGGASITERLASAKDAVVEQLPDASGAGAAAPHHESMSEAVQHSTTELHQLGLGGWSPSGMLQQLLDSTAYYTGLPWWATIILITCGIRLSVAPLLVYVQGNSIRLSNIQPQMQNLMSEMEYAKATGSPQEMQTAAIKVRKLLAENNCSPFRSLLLPLVQMPIFLSFYFALDGLAKAKLPALVSGGFSWVQDLSVADPYYVLPITSAFMTLLVIETGAETGTSQMNQTKQARFVKNLMRGVTVFAAWLVSEFPAAVLLYWTTTNTFSLVQLLVLRTRLMKRWLRLPDRIQHPVEPHGKKESFMDGFRRGMASQNALPNSAASRRSPAPSSLWARKGDADVSSARSRAVESIMSDSEHGAKAHAGPTAAQTQKQSRVQAARERRLRQRG